MLTATPLTLRQSSLYRLPVNKTLFGKRGMGWGMGGGGDLGASEAFSDAYLLKPRGSWIKLFCGWTGLSLQSPYLYWPCCCCLLMIMVMMIMTTTTMMMSTMKMMITSSWINNDESFWESALEYFERQNQIPLARKVVMLMSSFIAYGPIRACYFISLKTACHRRTDDCEEWRFLRRMSKPVRQISLRRILNEMALIFFWGGMFFSCSKLRTLASVDCRQSR